MQRRPATLWDVVDAAERYLDENKLDRPHLVGNSTGGFVALELARRGRAASVCVFSPAGFWSDELRARAIKRARFGLASMRFMRRITPLLMKAPSLRRYILRDFTLHGDLELYEATARDTLPKATFTVLPDVGHVPMLDDPRLVARTILAVTDTANA